MWRPPVARPSSCSIQIASGCSAEHRPVIATRPAATLADARPASRTKVEQRLPMDPTVQESTGTEPLLAVLMCTYNGQDYVEDQVRSIIDQTYKNLNLVISDDGSTDKTIETIRSIAAGSAQTITVRSGPGQGFAKNFLSLATDPSIHGDYFAFSDQDDVWAPEKLQAAIQNIAANEVTSKPYL
jgi:hypothetical protein